MSGVAAAMVAGSVITSRSQERSARRAADQAAEAARPVPISTPLFFTDVGQDGRVTGSLTGQGQGLLSGALSDYRSIPFSSITQPGFTYGQSDRDLLGRADTMFDRAGTALDRAQTPEASLSFLERAFGPQLAQARAAQENRLFNQGLLGSTAGGLQTEALSRGQQGAMLEGALQQQQFQGQLGQGLLGSAINTRGMFSDINLQRVNQDLAQRTLLNQARSGSLGAALGIMEAPGQGVATTLGGQGNAGAAAQAAAIGAQGAAQSQNAIMSGITSAGLGFLGMQQPTQTSRQLQFTPGGTSFGGGAPVNTRGIGPGFTYGIQ